MTNQLTKLNSNVDGFVEVVLRNENGFTVKIFTEEGVFHTYENLMNVRVNEFEEVNVGDLIGFINGELKYTAKVQPKLNNFKEIRDNLTKELDFNAIPKTNNITINVNVADGKEINAESLSKQIGDNIKRGLKGITY